MLLSPLVTGHLALHNACSSLPPSQIFLSLSPHFLGCHTRAPTYFLQPFSPVISNTSSLSLRVQLIGFFHCHSIYKLLSPSFELQRFLPSLQFIVCRFLCSPAHLFSLELQPVPPLSSCALARSWPYCIGLSLVPTTTHSERLSNDCSSHSSTPLGFSCLFKPPVLPWLEQVSRLSHSIHPAALETARMK